MTFLSGGMFPQWEENLWRNLAVKYMTVIKVRYGFKEAFYCLLFAFIFFLFCFPVEDSRWYLGKCQSLQSRERWALMCQVLSPSPTPKGSCFKVWDQRDKRDHKDQNLLRKYEHDQKIYCCNNFEKSFPELLFFFITSNKSVVILYNH